MFVGRSPEEIELAGEETDSVGFSLSEAFKNIFRNPAGRQAAGLFLGPTASAAITLADAARSSGSPKPVPQPRKPAPAPRAPQQTSTANDVPAGVSGMGAEAPMTNAEIYARIMREKNPMKRERMIMNFKRAIATEKLR